MKKKFGARLGVLAVITALSIAVMGMSAGPAAAHGCTPGFWKNKGAEQAASVDTTVGSVFTGFNATISALNLSEALSLQGGPGIDGAQEILARAAAAAYFNIEVTGDYPTSLATLQAWVATALATNDRGAILYLAADLDWFNNIGNPAVCG